MARLINGINCSTLDEAAAQLETTATKVLMLIRDKKLAALRVDGEWYVEADSLACCTVHGSDLKAASGCVSYCSAKGCGCK